MHRGGRTPCATGLSLETSEMIENKGFASRPPIRHTLPPPRRADPQHRRLFHPRRGWFRRVERWVNLLLSRNLFPWLPGMAAFYALQLRVGLTVSEADVPIAGLPQAFDGAGILFITDLHAGPFLSPAALRGVFDRLQHLQPDLLLLGGDLTTARVSELEEQRALFRELQAPLGVFAVLGNHDHYTGDPAAVRALLEDCGITVLHNRSVVLQRDGVAHDLERDRLRDERPGSRRGPAISSPMGSRQALSRA